METLEVTNLDLLIAQVLARTVADDLGTAKEALERKTPDASLAIARLAGVREMVEAASLRVAGAESTGADNTSLVGVIQDIEIVLDQARRFIRASETDPGMADLPEEVFRTFASIHLGVVRLLKNRGLRRRCMFAAYGVPLQDGQLAAADDSRYDA